MFWLKIVMDNAVRGAKQSKTAQQSFAENVVLKLNSLNKSKISILQTRQQ
jgi:hypothetical protein